MQSPPILESERKRLEVLLAINLLDTPKEELYDRITRIAQALFGVPISLITLIDAERQWFKSRQGFDVRETSRDISFCGHAIYSDGIFEIPDVAQDPRFSDNPLVTGHPHIRFYAGAPLVVDGHGVGTLCIIDTKPRKLSEDQCKALLDLRDVALTQIMQISTYAQNRELESNRELTKVITQAQSNFIRKGKEGDSFDRLLMDILEITDSSYGFLGEVLKTSEGMPYLKTYAVTDAARSEESQALYQHSEPERAENTNLTALFDHVLKTGKAVISNDPLNDPNAKGLPEGPPALNAFLGIPIYYDNELIAMVGIANRPGGYDEDLIEYLSPLLATIAQLTKAVQTDKKHQKNLVELARLSRVANQTTNGVVMTDVDGRIEWVNQGFTRISGYMPEEVYGRRPCDVLQGDSTAPEAIAIMSKALKNSEPFEVDVINYRKSGEPYWIHISCNPLRDPDGSLQGYMAIESDITATKEAERALFESEERLRGLFKLSPIGIALNDFESGKFLDLNSALLRPTGYTREEFMALEFWELTPLEYQQQEAQQKIHMQRTGRYGPYEKEYIRKDGSRYPVLLNGMVLKDKSGRELIWSMIEDISDRKRVERMKNDFISTVSHELRTPVTSILGALGLVRKGVVGDVPADMQEMLSIAYRNSERLSFLVNDLLDMEKLVAGELTFNFGTYLLKALLERAKEENKAYAERYGVRLQLGSIDNDVHIRVDAQRFQQIASNLLSNAIKFSPEGAAVTILITVDTDYVRISVLDQGPGVPDVFRDRIFNKFAQADSSDGRHQSGSGLGLAITRELVERMDGRIGFDSVSGQGACFWFELAIAD